MVHLAELPVEILEAVVSALATPNYFIFVTPRPLFAVHPDDIRAMAAIARCSRMFHRLVLPFLYKHVCLLQQVSLPRKLVSLLRYWDAHPEVPTFVRTIHINWRQRYQGRFVYPAHDAEFLEGLVQKFGLRPQKSWRGEHWLQNDNSTDLLAGLILLHARSLRFMDLGVDLTNHPSSFFRTISENVPAHLRFDSLETLRFYCFGDRSLNFIRPMLRLAPNVKVLHGSLGDGGRFFDELEQDIDWTGITHLALCEVRMNSDAVTQIVGSCRGLVKFEFSAKVPIRPREIIEALHRHKDTLRDLTLGFGGLCQVQVPASTYMYNFTSAASLNSFVHLETIRIRASDLAFGPGHILSILPDSLRELHVSESIYNYKDDIESLTIRVSEGALPNLKLLRFELFQATAKFVQTIRVMLEGVGVSCTETNLSETHVDLMDMSVV